MYYPYIRAKQFELVAIREFAEKYPRNTKIIPIIEPVRKNFNSLNKTLTILDTIKYNYALILNPQVGDIYTDSKIKNDIEYGFKKVRITQ